MDHNHDHNHGDHAGHDMGAASTTPSPVAALASTAASVIANVIENVTQAVVASHADHGHHDAASHHDHHANHAAELPDVDHHAHHANHNMPAAHDHGVHMMKMYFHFGFKEVILFPGWEIDSFVGMFFSFLVIFALGAIYEGLKTVRIYLQIKEAKRLKKRTHCGEHSVSMSEIEHRTEKSGLPTHSTLHNSTNASLLDSNGEGAVYAPTVRASDEADDPRLTFFGFMKWSTKRTTPLLDRFRLMQACLYCVQITLAYMLMLVAMTYNVYLTAAVVLGAGFGHWIFAVVQSTLSELASDACH